MVKDLLIAAIEEEEEMEDIDATDLIEVLPTVMEANNDNDIIDPKDDGYDVDYTYCAIYHPDKIALIELKEQVIQHLAYQEVYWNEDVMRTFIFCLSQHVFDEVGDNKSIHNMLYYLFCRLFPVQLPWDVKVKDQQQNQQPKHPEPLTVVKDT